LKVVSHGFAGNVVLVGLALAHGSIIEAGALAAIAYDVGCLDEW